MSYSWDKRKGQPLDLYKGKRPPLLRVYTSGNGGMLFGGRS